MLKIFTLPNGIKVATYHIPAVKSIHIGMSVKGGSIVEEPEKNGIAHFMEHMLVQGSPSYQTAQVLSNHIESLAGRYGASTSRFVVHYYISVPFLKLDDALTITKETFFEPLFPEEAMEKERHAVLNELKQHLDSKWYKYSEFFRKKRYTQESILQYETIGKEEIITKLTRQDLIDYWKKYFIPSNMYLFVGGNFHYDDLMNKVTALFGTYPSTKVRDILPPLSNQDFTNRTIALRHDVEFQMNYIDLSFPGVASTAPIEDELMQQLALMILGQLRTSRLFRLLRYERGLVYGVYAESIQLQEAGLVSITSEVAPEHLDEVVSIMVSEVKRFIFAGPTQKELDFAKNFMSNQLLMAFDNPSTIQSWVEGEFLWRDKIRLPEESIAIIEKITTENINDLIKKKWDLSKLNLIIQGQLDESKENHNRFKTLVKPLA